MFVAARIFAIGLSLALAGCISSGSVSGPPAENMSHTGPLSGNYAGADAGFLIVTLASRKDTRYDNWWLFFRKKDRSAKGQIYWGQSNPVDQRPLDIDDAAEFGHVDIRRLPPGDYEIVNFLTDLRSYRVLTWESKADFSIPFTIAPGRATYIGELIAVTYDGDKDFLGVRRSNAAHVLLIDRSDRDVPIAKHKEPALSEVTRSVINADTLANPIIKSGPR